MSCSYMASIFPTHLDFKPPSFPARCFHGEVCSVKNLQNTSFTLRIPHVHYHSLPRIIRNSSRFCKFDVLTRSCSDGDKGEVFTAQASSVASDVDTLRGTPSSSDDSYVALFIRMLGLDNNPQDREQAVITLWKYSLGGKQFVDNIMKFQGSINLVVNLLRSDSDAACEAAAGLLRVISSIHVYRDLVAESAVVEEITSLLRRSSLCSDVKEQSIYALCNLSVDEKLRARIANSEILYVLVKLLEDEDIKVKEAAAGVFANLALSQSNHTIMVEAGVIPKLAKLLNIKLEESKVIRKVTRSALLELAKNEYNKILIMEEGLVLVPLVGTTAYKSFRPTLHSWPSFPDGTKIEQASTSSSKYGASELLLGLNIQEKNMGLDDGKVNALVGRTHQQFLSRIGAIETEENNKSDRNLCSDERFTLLPWIDGVARLVLILGLEDESAIARAASSIAHASINEHMRISFMEAGAIKNLAHLINHPCDTVRLAVVRALSKLSISNYVCQKIEAEGILSPLLNLLKESEFDTSQSLTSMILSVLTRILDPYREMTSRFYGGTVNGSPEGWDDARSSMPADGNAMTSSELIPRSSIGHAHLFETTVLTCLVNILKKSNPDLQRKASSILEFVIVTEPFVERLVSAGIESGLEAVFQQKALTEMEDDTCDEQPELHSLELEEAGRAVSAASRLLTRLLDYPNFSQTVNAPRFTELLRKVLVSNIPVQNKDWVAASLVKLSSLTSFNSDPQNPISTQVTVHETIPRLLEQIKNPFNLETQEAAAVELNRIISEGLVDSTRTVASEGGIFPLVKLMENGSSRTKDASLSILYNLSMDSENHAAIVAAGGVPVLRKIVLSQGSQWMRALRLLRTLPTVGSK